MMKSFHPSQSLHSNLIMNTQASKTFVSRKRMRTEKCFPTLMKLIQHETKNKIRNDVCTAICEYEKSYISESHTALDYNMSMIFERVLFLYGALLKIQDVNLFDFILYDPEENIFASEYMTNSLTQLCVRGQQKINIDRDTEFFRDGLFLQFMGFIQSCNIIIALDIIKKYTMNIQCRILDDAFNLKNMAILLSWDKMFLTEIFMNNKNNHIHSLVSSVSSQSKILFEKIKMIVTCLGVEYLTWAPIHQAGTFIHFNLVNHILYHGVCLDDHKKDYETLEDILIWLIDKCPQALRIFSSQDQRCNGFTSVVQRYKNCVSQKHQQIVHLVMKHARVEEDIHGVIAGLGDLSLLQYTRDRKNTLVLEFFGNHFGIHLSE